MIPLGNYAHAEADKLIHQQSLHVMSNNIYIVRKYMNIDRRMSHRVIGDIFFNSLSPERCNNSFKIITFKLISQKINVNSRCELVVKWMQQNIANGKTTLIQVMAWCRQATCHYLSQCWMASLKVKYIHLYTACLLEFVYSTHECIQGMTRMKKNHPCWEFAVAQSIRWCHRNYWPVASCWASSSSIPRALLISAPYGYACRLIYTAKSLI